LGEFARNSFCVMCHIPQIAFSFSISFFYGC